MTRLKTLTLALALTGCSESSVLEGGDYSAGGDSGATVGGVQDIGYARELIANGQVPTAADIPVEGLLSEHDLPTSGPACQDMICLRPALGTAPSLSTGERAHWVHLGMSSALDANQRPPVDLVVLIDKSASMSIDMDEVNTSVNSIVSQLDSEDRLGVVAFDSSPEILHDLESVDDPQALQTRIGQIRAQGGWDLEAAMDVADDMFVRPEVETDRMHRVVLLTCGYPQAQGAFSEQVNRWATRGIGFTTVGVLLDWSPEIGDLLGDTRGGSMYYTETLQQTATLFDEEFDQMITPLAYDLQVGLDLDPAFQIDAVYGVPGTDNGIEIDVATVFASKRKGGIVARVSPVSAAGGQGTRVGFLSGTYEPESAHGIGAEATDGPLDAEVPLDDEAVHFAGGGVRKAVALVNQAEQMAAACTSFHQGDPEQAALLLEELLGYLSGEAEHFTDGSLDLEVALVSQLLDNVR